MNIAGSANQVQFCRVQTRIPVLNESAYEDISCILYYSQTDDCWNFLERTRSFEGIDCSSVTSAQVRSERGRALWGANKCMSLHTLETHALIFRTRELVQASHITVISGRKYCFIFLLIPSNNSQSPAWGPYIALASKEIPHILWKKKISLWYSLCSYPESDQSSVF